MVLWIDGRIGHSHMNVIPGHDGKFGFGGSCFPKDIQAMIDFVRNVWNKSKCPKGVSGKNLEVKSEQDWKELKGRGLIADE